MSPEQKAFLATSDDGDDDDDDDDGAITPHSIYRYRRKPTCVEDFYDGKDDMRAYAIWCENGTLLCVQCGHWMLADFQRPNHRPDLSAFHGERTVSFTIQLSVGFFTTSLWCTIYGKTDTAIAETLTFLWSLQHSNRKGVPLQIRGYAPWDKTQHTFDFDALLPEQLASIFDVHPELHLEMDTIRWSREQSVVLATRPYPLNWKLAQSFRDGGTAFVSALQTRQSPFGELCFTLSRSYKPSFSLPNLQRLFQLEGIFEKLDIHCRDRDYVLLPFSANVGTLHYMIESHDLHPEYFNGLSITTKDLHLELNLGVTPSSWDYDVLVSFLNQVAQLGHFERLGLSINACRWEDTDFDQQTLVAEALIRAIRANSKLMHLDLSCARSHRASIMKHLDWSSHFETLFDAMGDPNGHEMSKITIKEPRADPAFYSMLKKVLSRNRHVMVVNKSGDIISDGSPINKLYDSNHIYNKMSKLAKESVSLRATLVAMTLTEKAWIGFRYADLLLSHNSDALCELIDGLNFEEQEDEELAF